MKPSIDSWSNNQLVKLVKNENNQTDNTLCRVCSYLTERKVTVWPKSIN